MIGVAVEKGHIYGRMSADCPLTILEILHPQPHLGFLARREAGDPLTDGRHTESLEERKVLHTELKSTNKMLVDVPGQSGLWLLHSLTCLPVRQTAGGQQVFCQVCPYSFIVSFMGQPSDFKWPMRCKVMKNVTLKFECDLFKVNATIIF